MLGGVEGGVRGFDQVARALGVIVPGAGDANAGGNDLMAARDVRQAQGLHCGPHFLTDLAGARGTRVRQQQAKFLAAVTGGKTQDIGGDVG